MSLLTLYLLFLKATLSSFSGLASLPILREDFVVKTHLLTDRQLNTALVVGRTTPGPKGLYIVALGYYAAGYPGAALAALAVITPALLVLFILHFAEKRMNNVRFKRTLRAVVIASAGISLSATLPLGADALTGIVSYALAGFGLVLLIWTKIDTLWVILGAAAANLVAAITADPSKYLLS